MDVLTTLLRFVALGAWHLVRALAIGLVVALRGFFAACRFLFSRRSTAHGSARWASWRELWWGNAFGRPGIVLGKAYGRLLTFSSEGHALVVAASRGGKTAGICVPSILEAKGSVIAVDPKAELHDLTYEDRSRPPHRGLIARLLRRPEGAPRPVYRLDLIDPENSSDRFNPLDLIRTGTIHEPDDALALAALMVDDSTDNAAHWDYKAREVLAALMLFVSRRYAHEPARRTLWKIKSLTSLGLADLVSEMDGADALGSETLAGVYRALRGAKESPEALSIISNTDKALLLYSSDRPAGMVTGQSDFDMGIFRREVATLYLIVPSEKLAVQGPFLRLMLGCALMMQTREQHITPRHKPLFVVDEAGVIGGIPELATGVAVGAAVARILMIFQDFGQVERNYGKLARSLIANAGAFVCFSVRDLETATTVSRLLGNSTIRTHSDGSSQSSTALLRHSSSSGRAESGRPILDPSELIRLRPDQAIGFINGVRYPIRLTKIRYWRVWRYRSRVGRWRGHNDPRPPSPVGKWQTEP